MSSSKSYAVRRRPGQDRSKKRVASILDAAKKLIAERGIEPITMTQVAKEAGMGLTALYRYFPNKSSVIYELSAQMLEQDRSGVLIPALETEIEVSVDEFFIETSKLYVKVHLEEPHRIPLRMAIQSDAELLSFDLQDTQDNAEILANKIASLAKVKKLDKLKDFFLLFLNLLASTTLLMAYTNDEKAAGKLLDTFLTMSLREIHSILEESQPVDPQI